MSISCTLAIAVDMYCWLFIPLLRHKILPLLFLHHLVSVVLGLLHWLLVLAPDPAALNEQPDRHNELKQIIANSRPTTQQSIHLACGTLTMF